jgi:lipid II:glycine glycyltransferase (peptidoglycan interpeptide bridge formation enzyme)
MINRDEYVTKLKAQLDRWNEDVTRWEGQAKQAQAEAKKRYEKELEVLRAQREKAMYQLKLLEGASSTAWTEFTLGADEAWKRMRIAFDEARAHFEKAQKAEKMK